MSIPTSLDAARATQRVHILGAGPVGLVMAAMLQSLPGYAIRVYEKRPTYVRTRMVKLAPYLIADSLSAYAADEVDGDNVAAIFDATELEAGLRARRSIDPKLVTLIQEWSQGFCPLNIIEEGVSAMIEQGGPSPVERISGNVSVDQALAMVAPDDIMIDCTGCNSLLRNHLVPPQAGEANSAERNTYTLRLEYAVNVTFLYAAPYQCNEYCKYYKNRGNGQYKFIPAVDRIARDAGVTHVFGIISVSAEDFAALPPQCKGDLLREQFPAVATSMDRFIEQINAETGGHVIGDIDVIRIPLNLYHARNATNRAWHAEPAGDHSDAGPHAFSKGSVFLVGDSAIGSPYFQSISLGIECAMFLADLLQQGIPMSDVRGQYETRIYKQWLRVYMRSKTIKHSKDIFERLDDTFGVLEKLKIY